MATPTYPRGHLFGSHQHQANSTQLSCAHCLRLLPFRPSSYESKLLYTVLDATGNFDGVKYFCPSVAYVRKAWAQLRQQVPDLSEDRIACAEAWVEYITDPEGCRAKYVNPTEADGEEVED